MKKNNGNVPATVPIFWERSQKSIIFALLNINLPMKNKVTIKDISTVDHDPELKFITSLNKDGFIDIDIIIDGTQLERAEFDVSMNTQTKQFEEMARHFDRIVKPNMY